MYYSYSDEGTNERWLMSKEEYEHDKGRKMSMGGSVPSCWKGPAQKPWGVRSRTSCQIRQSEVAGRDLGTGTHFDPPIISCCIRSWTHGPIIPIQLYSKLTPPLILASNSHWNKIRTHGTNLHIIGFQNLLELTQYLVVALKDQGFLSLLYSTLKIQTGIKIPDARTNTLMPAKLPCMIILGNLNQRGLFSSRSGRSAQTSCCPRLQRGLHVYKSHLGRPGIIHIHPNSEEFDIPSKVNEAITSYIGYSTSNPLSPAPGCSILIQVLIVLTALASLGCTYVAPSRWTAVAGDLRWNEVSGPMRIGEVLNHLANAPCERGNYINVHTRSLGWTTPPPGRTIVAPFTGSVGKMIRTSPVPTGPETSFHRRSPATAFHREGAWLSWGS